MNCVEYKEFKDKVHLYDKYNAIKNNLIDIQTNLNEGCEINIIDRTRKIRNILEVDMELYNEIRRLFINAIDNRIIDIDKNLEKI